MIGYRSGTVVVCNYINFKGENKKGLFVVVGDEAFNNNTSNFSNFTAIKITTQLNMIGNYAVNLDLTENPFFKYPCIASCSKIHTLHKNQVDGKLGILSEKTFKEVYKTYSLFVNELNRQMMSNL